MSRLAGLLVPKVFLFLFLVNLWGGPVKSTKVHYSYKLNHGLFGNSSPVIILFPAVFRISHIRMVEKHSKKNNGEKTVILATRAETVFLHSDHSCAGLKNGLDRHSLVQLVMGGFKNFNYSQTFIWKNL
jgi:hypothetical protein